jgi:hypothetical protein
MLSAADVFRHAVFFCFMATAIGAQGWLKKWLFRDVSEMEGPGEPEGRHVQHPWWKVMCLTGVDYFSTLGYQPGIAFLAAGALSPFATLVLVLLTLFGALPMYCRVAEDSPHGDGSISMLENLLSRWKGKMFVLVLLGFVATSFIITITLSAADATAHIIENPYVQQSAHFLEHPIIVTLILIALLGAVFLKGFNEAIGLAVGIVVVFLTLTSITIGRGLYEILVVYPAAFENWKSAVWTHPDVGGSLLWLIIASLWVFPKLALGLSGFETGVVVMPLVKSDVEQPNGKAHKLIAPLYDTEPSDREKEYIASRIKNGKKLLGGAAIIMSFMLVGSSIITSMLIPPQEFQAGGQAYGRAVSFLAHGLLGDVFGTIYDVSTIMILWFAGASAMAGLLNIVPRYLPRYGMAPDWAKAVRPLVLVFTAICFAVTWLFEANVEAQGGAYATGVLTLMTSAALAVAIAAWRRKKRGWFFYAAITAVFLYTTTVNIIEQPSGLKIASAFILAIIGTSFVSRVLRSTEIRIDEIVLDTAAQAFLDEVDEEGEVRIVTNRREAGDMTEYRFKEHEKRVDNHIPSSDPILFYEIEPGDSSEFKGKLFIRGVDVEGYRILRTQAPAVPNAIAAFLLYLRDQTGKIPHVYFGWSEGNPIMYLARYILFGEGDTAPVTREILRQAEPDPELRPNVHVGG